MKNTRYDFSKIPDYTKRQMFLDPAGPVTIQRFDDFAYPRISKLETLARGFYWIPEEVSLMKDKSDHENAREAVRFAFTENLLRQTGLDSEQGASLSQILPPVISIPELEALVSNWTFFETNIHSRSYSHIIQNIYSMPKKQFNAIHENQQIIDMAANVGKHYDALDVLNCKKKLGLPVSEKEHIRAIWMALHVSYALEAIRFMVSFATSLAMVENKIYIGNGTIIALILQDELLHAEWTAYIINRVVKDDPRFAEVAVEMEPEVYAMYLDVIREEKTWADHVYQKGPIVGLNAEIAKDFVDNRATLCLKEIGIKYLENPIKVSPLPWFNKHLDSSKEQVALQENESASYVIGAMGSEIDFNDLPDL